VVATSVGNIPLLVQHEVNGLLIDPGKPEAIVEAVERLMKDAPLHRLLVNQGVRFVQNHTIENETERMMAVVSEHFGVRFRKGDPHWEESLEGAVSQLPVPVSELAGAAFHGGEILVA